MNGSKKVKAKVSDPLTTLPEPVITERVPRKVRKEDTIELKDTSLLVSIDFKRQDPEVIDTVEITDGQRFFPYTLAPRLLVGWQAVNFISSFELKIGPSSPLPEMTVRFVEKMTDEDVKALDPGVRAQIEEQMAMVRQYPFVKVESPLLR
jgi:hypothetical protein